MNDLNGSGKRRRPNEPTPAPPPEPPKHAVNQLAVWQLNHFGSGGLL